MLGLFLLLLYAVSEGITDGILWSRKGHEALKQNEHVVLFAGRVIVFMVALTGVHWILLMLAACMFPFLHAGTYYETRKKIDTTGKTYPEGWRSEPSEDSSAKFNFTFKMRLWLFLGGLGVTVIYYIIK
jgi:hypothetical protein